MHYIYTIWYKSQSVIAIAAKRKNEIFEKEATEEFQKILVAATLTLLASAGHFVLRSTGHSVISRQGARSRRRSPPRSQEQVISITISDDQCRCGGDSSSMNWMIRLKVNYVIRWFVSWLESKPCIQGHFTLKMNNGKVERLLLTFGHKVSGKSAQLSSQKPESWQFVISGECSCPKKSRLELMKQTIHSNMEYVKKWDDNWMESVQALEDNKTTVLLWLSKERHRYERR